MEREDSFTILNLVLIRLLIQKKSRKDSNGKRFTSAREANKEATRIKMNTICRMVMLIIECSLEIILFAILSIECRRKIFYRKFGIDFSINP